MNSDMSVIILTLNESLHVERAINSLQRIGIVLDIWVVDSGSTDETATIAARLGATVVVHPFTSHSRQFQWALDHLPLQGAWTMRLDADEVVSVQLGKELAAAIRYAPAGVDGFALRRRHIFWNRWLRFGGRWPLVLLRVWRTGCARVEDRWMDEHIVFVQPGRAPILRSPFDDHNLKDLSYFTAKHADYATREAVDVLLRRYSLAGSAGQLLVGTATSQARLKRLLKLHLYNRLPFPLAAFGYFFVRYILQLGILDGLPGLVYHLLQGGWYRFLVGARVHELDAAIRTTKDSESQLQILERLSGLPLRDTH